MSVPVRPQSLTSQQESALHVKGASVALSAGAGCGKTLVLTERFLRLLEGPTPLPLRSIVALTFTEKAARELRERVRLACRRRLDEGVDAAYWRSILRGLEAAPIGTFHGFCGELLRRFPIEAGIEPGFAIVEEAIAPTLRDAALSSCFRQWLASGNEDLRILAVEFGLSAVRQELTDLITDRGGNDYQSWALRKPDEIVAIWESAWKSKVRPRILESILQSGESLIHLFDAHPCSHNVMQKRIDFMRQHVPLITGSADPVGLLSTLREHAVVKGGGGKSDWPSEEAFEEVKARLTTFRGEIDKACQALEFDESGSLDAAEYGVRFARLASEAVARYDDWKRSRGMIDFDDLLLKTRDLLRDGPPSVREELSKSIEVILVDEFQDTDPVQGEILELLAGPELCQGRLFLVGDVKQSIYRFRGARPELFQEFRERFPVAGQLALTDNFRSVSQIIDFVNALFGDHFRGEEHLLRAASRARSHEEPPVIEFLWAEDPAHDQTGKTPVARRRATEARWIARHLKNRLDAGWPIWDSKESCLRDANPGDVVYLFRTLNDAAAYEHALVQEGLDYYIVGGAAFFAQQEVLDLINLLSSIEDPLDELALAGVLRSPFFGVSDEGLYWLVARGGDLPTGLLQYQSIEDLSARDRQRIARAHESLRRWRSTKDHVSIDTTLERALDESGYEAALLGEHLGERKRANVRKLVRLARRFDAQGGMTLADFVARLRADLRKPPREEQAATVDERGDAVRLMSIHQAKGLEFPIVVVPDLDRGIPAIRDRVTFHSDLGILVQPPNDPDTGESRGTSLGWTVFRQIEAREEEQEALRLFYVAVTRARDALILSAGLSATEEPKSPALRLLADRFDRETGHCKARLPSDWTLPAVHVILQEPPATQRVARSKPARNHLAVARTIQQSRLEPELPLPTSISRPRWMDLDALRALEPTARSVDRLLRAILNDSESLDLSRLSSVGERAARVVIPMASADLVEETILRVSTWLRSRVAQDLAGSTEILRAIEWVLTWPPGSQDATTFRGRTEFAFRDSEGVWQLAVLAEASVSVAHERLRLLLSARALGLEPLRRGWIVRLGPGGGILEVDQFEDREIENAIEAVL